MTPPLDHFPDRHDYERGCMADGSHLRFASRALYPSWGSPLPGKSNVLKKARKQDVPPDCGSILIPDEGEFPHTGVPCPVPEQGDASIEARLNKSEEELHAFTFGRIAEINNGMMEMYRMGVDASRFLAEHPEINFGEHAAPRAQAEPREDVEPREDSQPRERRATSDDDKYKAMRDQAGALNTGFDADKSRWAQMGDGEEDPVARGERSERACETHRVSQVGPVCSEDSSSSQPSSVNSTGNSSDVPAPDDTGGGARATTSANAPRPYRAFRVPEKECASAYARCRGLMDLAARIAPRLHKMTLEQDELGQKMIDLGRKKNVKEAFLENRAVAILKNSLLHCDELFRDLGFGGWMPFRYADQWLAFTSLMRKLLAANGLITPKGPNHWRDFIENTPEVQEDKLRLPKSLGPTKKYAAVESIEEVTKQAKEAAKKDPAARRRFDQRFAMGP
jgi:hypothetical protein